MPLYGLVGRKVARGNRFEQFDDLITEHDDGLAVVRRPRGTPFVAERPNDERQSSPQVCLQHSAQLLLRPVEVRFHRAHRQVERLCEILVCTPSR